MLAPTLLGWCAGLVGTSFAAPLSPDALVRAALRADPHVVAAEARLSAARGALAEARGPRFNPTLSGAASLTSDQLALELVQPMSPVEGGHRAQAAQAALRAAELDLARARLEAAAEARILLAQAAVAVSVEALSEELLDDARARRDLAERRVEAGEWPALEARLARLELASAAEAAIRARQEADAARVRIAGLLPEAGGEGLVLPEDPRAAVPAPTRSVGDRLDVSAASARVQAADATARAARAGARTALDLGAFAERDGGAWSVGPSLSLTVPLWHAHPAERASAAADLAEASAALTRIEAEARAEQRLTGAARADADLAEQALGPDALKDASEALRAVEAAVRSGELDRSTASLLRAEIRAGASSALALRGAVAEAHVRALLANDDPALLPAEVSP